ncbi:hypothetical protein ACFWPH_33700 [Nocardia sp. NPDC058499]|uniref:hypothetical protein n=1 Tax=Nocardia sp. NPDC058499 TaxID=3346530 RepID=UPI003658D2DA
MTATLATPSPATPTLATVDLTLSPFAYAVWDVDYLLDTDPRRARRVFAEALTSASAAERAFLEQVADMLTRNRWPVAARQLGWLAKSRPELRDMVIHYTTDTDPGLHFPAMPRISEAPIEATEWVRRSIREQHDRDRLTATPSELTDKARLRPEALAYRLARRPRRLPAGMVDLRHRGRDRRTVLRREAEFAAYAATRLYAIDHDFEAADAEVVADPRKPADAVWAHVQAGLWDRSYYLHVAQNYTDRDRELLDPEPPATGATRARSGRHTALDDQATQYLRAHGSDPGISEERRDRPRRRPAARGYVRVLDQNRLAQKRTGIPTPSDYDEFRPYSELDAPETTWEGSGLDYDLAAMVPYLGWPCVNCWIDRADIDRRPVHQRVGRLVSDDGLCDFCRDAGHPGIPPLSAPWTGRDFVESRCAYIATTYPRQARALLDRIRAAAANSGPTWRLITRWMATHLDGPTPTPRSAARTSASRPRRSSALGAGQRIGRCDGCARNGVVHADNLCTQCRVDLGVAAPRERTSSAA